MLVFWLDILGTAVFAVSGVLLAGKLRMDPFCMGAAWKNPHERDMPYLQQMVQGVKAMGMETCMTLGTLDGTQAERIEVGMLMPAEAEGVDQL
ncbi:TRIC cation channel family protein, partial [Serratia ureilytica]|nr:TRIC cation channel family protein [Serratia ureilytica]